MTTIKTLMTPPVMPDKLPPQNLDAERSLLGSLLSDREAINKVADMLGPDDFYQRNHQLIWQAVFGLFERHDNIDIMSVGTKLTDMGKLDEIGGIGYLTSLASSVPTAAHVQTYARIVQRKKTLRNLIDTANHIVGLGHREDEDVDALLDEAERRLFEVSQKTLTHKFGSLTGELDAAMERIQNQDDGVLRGVASHHTRLDQMLGGFQKSDLIILAARPSVGKTAFAIDIARRAAEHQVPVGIFSLEMSMDQVVDRLVASKAKASLWHLRTGKLSHEGDDFLNITNAITELREMPIYIDDSSNINVLQMRAMARRLKAEHGLGLLVVDYLQLMSARRNYDSMVTQVTEISRGLKGLAKELNIPVIALSQLSRAVENREGGGGKPRLSDLRDSGSIEQDADVVMFIHRDDKFNFARAKEEGKLDLAQLIIAKHRNGPTGEIDFHINPRNLEFNEVDRAHTDSGDFL